MTDFTPEARQMAADLANAERRQMGHEPTWGEDDFSAEGSPGRAERATIGKAKP